MYCDNITLDSTLNNNSDTTTQLNKYKGLNEYILLMNYEKVNKQYSFINAHDQIPQLQYNVQLLVL